MVNVSRVAQGFEDGFATFSLAGEDEALMRSHLMTFVLAVFLCLTDDDFQSFVDQCPHIYVLGDYTRALQVGGYRHEPVSENGQL